MNTKSPIWNEYIAFYTRKPVVPTLAIVPSEPPPLPSPAYPLASIRLGERTYRKQDGTTRVSQQWSHAIYPVIGERGEYLMLQTMHGAIYRKRDDVRIQGAMVAEKKIA